MKWEKRGKQIAFLSILLVALLSYYAFGAPPNACVSSSETTIIYIDNLQEMVCIEDENRQTDKVIATQPGEFTYTYTDYVSGKKYYLDLVSNTMPSIGDITANSNYCQENVKQNPDNLGGQYYSYYGSNNGWIGCQPGGDFPIRNLGRTFPEFPAECDPNPHIRGLYDRMSLNTNFKPSQLDDGADEDGVISSYVLSAYIPLLSSEDVLMQAGDINLKCSGSPSDDPPGQEGTLCQRGAEVCVGRIIKSSDTDINYLCCEGSCEISSGSTIVDDLQPEFICVKRSNIGFWAGCGANIESEPHNFYPGGTPTSIKDFGTTIYGDGTTEPKPGSMYLYNQILALGLPDNIAGNVHYGWKYTIDPLKYNDQFVTDWTGYTKLTFFFKAVKKPELYQLILQSMVADSCSEVKRVKINDGIDADPINPNKWYRVEIPLADIAEETKENMCGIYMLAESSDITPIKDDPNFQADLDFPPIPSGGPFRDIIFLDRFALVSGDREFYCAFVDTGGDRKPDSIHWINTLNNVQVCNEQPGHIWTGDTQTGDHCCGDNPDETYIDPSDVNPYACWEGEAKANDELVPITIQPTNMYCRTRETNCETGETAVLRLSSLTSAHGALPGESYNHVVCCKSPEGELVTNEDNTILRLSDTNNAHATVPEFDQYYSTTIDLQLNSESKQLSCEPKYYQHQDGQPKKDGYEVCQEEGHDTCLVSLSSVNDPKDVGGAHLEDCYNKNYPHKLCCRIENKN